MNSSLLQRPIVLSLLSAIMLCLSWPAIGDLSFLVFGAFIPLLLLEDQIAMQSKGPEIRKVFSYSFLSFLLWNIGCTYFIMYIRLPQVSEVEQLVSRLAAGGSTYILNASFMAIVFCLFHFIRKRLGEKSAYPFLVFLWLAFEYVHMHWSINWPWLNLGHVFAQDVAYIQWYEFTGVAGGTTWILLVNIFLFQALKRGKSARKKAMQSFYSAMLLLMIPIAISIFTYLRYEEQGEAVEIVCVQPNLDPYSTKFSTDPIQQLERMVELIEEQRSDRTEFYVLPETALQEGATVIGQENDLLFSGLWEHQLNRSVSASVMRDFLADSQAAIVTGSADRAYYKKREHLSARYLERLNIYYDNFNSTYLVSNQGVEEVYHKSKLVPGVESIPFVEVLSFLDDLALDLGGASGSLGVQEQAEVFEHQGKKIAPTICYESVFGDYTADFVRRGAEAIFISTNDSWWQDSPGYRQLLHYGRLRAIETRRSIARSANTGITCFIDQRGNIIEELPWWTEGALRGEIHFNKDLSFYAQYGDYIGRTASFISLLILVWGLAKPRNK